MSGQKPREIAAQVLAARGAGSGFIEDVLEKALAPAQLVPPDRRLAQELAYGVARWQATLDWLIARKTDGRPQKPALLDLLRLGLYQIFWLNRVPDHAAVNETVELAKCRGFGPQAGFVNAVLRGYLREFESTKQSLAELKITQPATGYSHPAWLVGRWQQRWGAERSARLMDWNNTPPKTYARVNLLKLPDAGPLLAQWRDEDVEYDFVRRDWLEDNLVFELKSHPPLAALPSFRDGKFYVQDPSTLFAVRELDPQPGETILDLCAAPGGKATYAAQRMRNEGKIVAQDVFADRLRLVQENCARLGVTIADCRLPVADFPPAGGPDKANRQSAIANPQFNKVLLDAPCSNTGVMRRRVDLRWRIRAEEIARLRATQLGLLRQAAAVLEPGGTLVYSTCSLEPEENQGVVEEFLRAYPEFRLERERELLPFVDDVDGAFVATLRRPAGV